MIQRPPIFGGIFVLWVTGWVTFQIYLKIIQLNQCYLIQYRVTSSPPIFLKSTVTAVDFCF